MYFQVINIGSYGGEMIFVVDPPEDFWEEVCSNGVPCHSNSSRKWFMLKDISLISNKKFSQKLIDWVEELGDYDIPFSVKHHKTEGEPIKTASRFINKKSRKNY